MSIDKVFHEENRKSQDLLNQLKTSDQEALHLYNKLEDQKNSAQSVTLTSLLDAEIKTYRELNAAFNKCFKIQSELLAEDNDNLKQVINYVTEKQLEQQQALYLLNNIIPINNSMSLYLQAISRDYKDWSKLCKMLLKAGVDTAAENIPVVSNIKSIFDKVNQISDLVNEYIDDGTDYSEIDRELLIIEIHTEVMKNTTQLFLYQADILSQED